MSIQVPPNLSPGRLSALIGAGLNDWGGVSPVTPDHVNPEAPWPEIAALERETRAAGRWLAQRLPIVPGMICDVEVITGSRSILTYLLKPIEKAFDMALTER